MNAQKRTTQKQAIKCLAHVIQQRLFLLRSKLNLSSPCCPYLRICSNKQEIVTCTVRSGCFRELRNRHVVCTCVPPQVLRLSERLIREHSHGCLRPAENSWVFRGMLAILISFGRDIKSRWSLLLSGVYARGSKISHTGGKCVTCSGLTNSGEGQL